jgi:hypothetical protein
MPIYTFKCRECEATVEVICTYERRGAGWTHDTSGCNGGLDPVEGLEAPTLGKPSFQTQAILENGAKVSGQFGKFARRKKAGWHRP